MVAHKKTDGTTSITAVRSMFVCGGGMSDLDFQQILYEVRQANPDGDGHDFVKQVMDAAVKQLSSGMGCC